MNIKDFCQRCRHKDTKANQHPCDSCMEMGINDNAAAPLGFEADALERGRKKSRYIDADKLRNEWSWASDSTEEALIQEFIVSVDNQPTADVVEAPVRCRHCKHFRLSAEGYFDCNHVHGLNWPQSPDDFCSYGERKTE